MRIYKFEGKTKEDIIEDIKTSTNTDDDGFIAIFEEQKGGIFKQKKLSANIYLISEIIDELKKFLEELFTNLGVHVKYEAMSREKRINIKVYSDASNFLIGKNGKMLDSIQTILKEYAHSLTGIHINITLDVDGYKQKRERDLIRLANTIAREVSKTGIETKLEPMNSYERRIIHEALKENRYVYSESIGEEPNRCLVIKKK